MIWGFLLNCQLNFKAGVLKRDIPPFDKSYFLPLEYDKAISGYNSITLSVIYSLAGLILKTIDIRKDVFAHLRGKEQEYENQSFDDIEMDIIKRFKFLNQSGNCDDLIPPTLMSYFDDDGYEYDDDY
jgi:hypothetical protein